MGSNDFFEYSTEGYDKAKAWLIEIGKWDEVLSHGISTDGWSIIHEANSIHNKHTTDIK